MKLPFGNLLMKRKSNERLGLRKKSPYLVDDTCSESTVSEGAAWRVENILANGPPKASDWWEPVDEAQRSDESDDMIVDNLRFRNRGLETFEQVQQAWRIPSSSASPDVYEKRKTSYALRRDVVKRISNQRQAELPKVLPLKDVIGAYTSMWHGDSD